MPRKPRIAPSPIATSIDRNEQRKYEARDALRTLTRADEIRKDKALMRDVKREAKAQIKTVSSVLGRGARSKREQP